MMGNADKPAECKLVNNAAQRSCEGDSSERSNTIKVSPINAKKSISCTNW